MMETTPRSKGNVLVARDQSPRNASEQAAPRRPGLFEWWYRLTAPAEPPTNASLAQREAARKGRLASTTLLFMSLVTVLPIPVAVITSNTALLVALLVTLFSNGVALLLNRLGKLAAAGALFVTVLNIGFMLSLLTTPGGLDMSNLPTFDLLAEALLVSVAFFPPWSIFLVLLINSLFILLDLIFQRHTPALAQYLTMDAYDVLVRPIILQIIVAIVTYLWVRSAIQAIVRADRAEEIAALEQREVERQQQEIEQKRQLDLGIQKILETHVEVAKGNYRARAPLTQDNILWRIAYSLNNLLARIQSAHQAEVELQHMRRAVAQVSEAVRIAKKNQRRVQVWQTGTELDQLIQELGLSPFSPSVPPLRANPPMERNSGS